MALDATRYVQPGAFERERHAVFAHAWLPVGVIGQLQEPGRYLAGAPGGWPVLVVRGVDGELRAFHNRCRHRELVLAEHDSGVCTRLRCRHHGWTYDLAGDLVDTPPAVAPAGERRAYALEPLALRQWRQVILVHLQPGAAQAPWQEPEGALPGSAAACRHYAGARMVDAACNWKTLLEAALTDDAGIWMWPTLLVRARGDLLLIDQVVARTALRTRVIRHAFLADAARDEAVRTAWAELDSLKAQTEQLQAQRALGKAADGSHARVAQFHDRLADALARDASATREFP